MFKRGGLLCIVMLFFCVLVKSSFAEESVAQSCVPLLAVDLDEHEILKGAQQQILFEQYMGQCIDGAMLKAIVSDTSSFYMDRGYITTRAFLKSQNILDGQVDISILNGSIEDIVNAKTKVSTGRIKTAFAFQKDSILDLRDLETSLEMMNRVSSSDASFKIKPGSEPGMSIVEVESRDVSPYHLKLGIGGRKNLNDNNLYLTGEFILDNPLNINDILKVNYNGSRVQQVYQSNNGVEVNYSFPIASYLIEVVGTDFSYRQGVNGSNATYLSSGDTRGLRLRVNKVLWRNQKQKLSSAVSVSYKDSKNYFANQVLDVSSYKTTQVQADLSHTYISSWGQLSTTYSYYQGVDWFGARSDNYLSAETGLTNQAKLQFVKHSIDSNLLYYLSDKSYKFNANVHVQFSNDVLYDNDKLTVGSDYTVRGYSSFNLYGNNAWYIKNDLKKTWQTGFDSSLLQNISLSLGLDYGEVKCEQDNLSSCGSIVGTALSLSSQGKHLHTNIVWSKPLKKINNTFRKDDLFIFDMTWEF